MMLYENIEKHVKSHIHKVTILKLTITFVLPTIVVLLSTYISNIRNKTIAQQYLSEIQEKKLLGTKKFDSIYKKPASFDSVESQKTIKKRRTRNEQIISNNLDSNSLLSYLMSSPKNEETCSPRKFVFLKTHRSGGSTIKSMFIDWQVRNDYKSCLSPNGPESSLGGWPGPFKSSFYFKPKYTTSLMEKTDVIFENFRWDWIELQKVLKRPKDIFRIGIIRNPIDVLKSHYNWYYKMRTRDEFEQDRGPKSNADHSFCFGSPFIEISQGNSASDIQPLSEIIKTLRKNEQIDLNNLPYNFRINNSQSHDFNYLNAAQIAEQFDFIIVIDRLKESLLLSSSRR